MLRQSDTVGKGQVIAQASFALSLVVTAVLAAVQAMGGNVLSRTWAKLLVMVGLVAAVYLGSSRDFYMPFLGPNVVPSSLLQIGTPTDATVALTVVAPPGATHVMYWAAQASLLTSSDPTKAYGAFSNSGVVPVAGGRATLRLACPGTYQVGMIKKVLPRHVHFRYVFKNGMVSSVKTQAVACP